MAATQANRLPVGSAPWIAEEKSSACQLVQAETEEFTFSARNEVEWLNEHMAEIFSENHVTMAEIFKTPGKLRGKTPRTIRKNNLLEERAPLSDVFSATPRGAPSPFKKIHFENPVPTFRVAEDLPTPADEAGPSAPAVHHASPPKPVQNAFDSGYHGSQPEDATQKFTQQPEATQESFLVPSPAKSIDLDGSFEIQDDDDENVEILGRDSDVMDTQGSPSDSFTSAKEEQTRKMANVEPEAVEQDLDKENEPEQLTYPVLESPLLSRQDISPQKYSPQHSSPPKKSSPIKDAEIPELQPAPEAEDENMEDVQSPSEGSSPLRPIVRKSSLNFASLPAREPLTNKKSIGNRVSRTSQLEQPRTSYYGRQTGGKSIGNLEDDEDDEMDVDQVDAQDHTRDDTDSKMMRLHNKTSTQRLQDQISMLGKSQNLRASKSIPNATAVPAQNPQSSQAAAPRDTRQASPQRSPERKSKLPGTFPGDDEDDSWIGAPPAAATVPSIFSPRPVLTKSHTTEVMEGMRQESVGGSQFNVPKRGDPHRNMSPVREPVIPDRTTSTLGHVKSVSTSVIRSPRKPEDSPDHRKPITVSNPNPSVYSKDDEESTTPPKSPSRSFRGSPLKAAKDKFSSILKTSRGLFASSAAVSADAKSSAISPVAARIAAQDGPSFEEAISERPESVHYPELLKVQSKGSQLSLRMPESPFKHTPRKTRASTEREEKRKEDEAREAKAAKKAREEQKMEEKLEKERQKTSEQARVYRLEQERVASMQKEVEARKEQERLAKASQAEIPRATRTSPRKTKAQLEAEGIAAAASVDELAGKDTEMTDASMPPPARPKSQIGRPAAKRPVKPGKGPATAKPPTVIRVDTGSQRGHGYHPSNTTLAASLQDSLSAVSQSTAPSQGLKHKVSTSSIQSKTSSNGFKSAATKALEAAARKKEQDEQAAAKKREAKAEVERQRAAIKEEERRKEEQQRRQEAERQREIQRERERLASIADAKKAASRQAMEERRLKLEKAKETRPPPPATRPQQPSGEHDKALPPLPSQRVEAGPLKTPQMNQSVPRTQQEMGRSMLNGAKAPPKRPLQQDTDDHGTRPTLQRNGPSYQQNEQQSKRRKTDDFDDDDEDMTEDHPKMTAPPIRHSSVRQKDVPTKSLFPNGYANVPPPNNLQRSTLISQHNMNQQKPTHPMDMATVSKAPIPFAASSSQANSQHKTPARPGVQNTGKSIGKSGAKSAAKSSPRYQNGESIELPEINTDDDDSDKDSADDEFIPLGWTNSPDLRRALFEQEKKDPSEVFGNPGPLNMEEVFSKSKDRFHKFRARTSSANWTGQDRLTEDEIKKDLEARDKVRRQGGWTYDTMV